MLISDIYSPPLLHGTSAEEAIFTNGIGDFYDEVRRVIFDTTVIISPKKTEKKGQGATAAIGLASALNEGLGIGLNSFGWAPLKAPGGRTDKNMVDWFKSKKAAVAYAANARGVGMEIQFGNNYQINEDIKRLSEAFIAGQIVAGIIMVSSNLLAKHKADRGAFFSDTQDKLDRHYATLYGAGASRIPPIMVIGIQHDGYNDNVEGNFEITPMKYSVVEGKTVGTPQSVINGSKVASKE